MAVIIAIIAMFRAEKGKRTNVLIMIWLAVLVIFNSVAAMNMIANANTELLLMTAIYTLLEIIINIIVAFISSRKAEKANKK